MKLRPVLLLLLLVSGVLIVVLALVQAAPRLDAVLPAEGGSPVPARSPIRLTFSRPMLPDSVTARLSTDPARAGAAEWQGETLIFTPEEPWPLGRSVTVSLEAGALSTLRLPMLSGQRWSFLVSRPQLLYLWPASGPADLYALEVVEGEIQRLTETPHGVLDYDIDPGGTAVVFSRVNAQGGADLYRLDRLSGQSEPLLKCLQEVCQQPQISPQGDQLAFQRLSLSGGEAQPALIQLLPLGPQADGRPTTLAELSRPSETLDWSPDGRLLYHVAAQGVFEVIDPVSGERQTFPNQTGQPGSWSPDGSAYVAPELLDLPGLETGTGEPVRPSHLLRYGAAEGSLQDLSGQLYIEDTRPTFSPEGSRVAFARKFLDASRWSLGRQLWVMDIGGRARPLTDEPVFNHTEFAWNPDGSRLVFLRFDQTALTRPPEIWQVDADGSAPLRLVIGGYAPQWTP